MNKLGGGIIVVGIFMMIGGLGTVELTGNLSPVEAYDGLHVGLLTALFGGLAVIMGLLFGKTQAGENENLPTWKRRRNKRLLGR